MKKPAVIATTALLIAIILIGFATGYIPLLRISTTTTTTSLMDYGYSDSPMMIAVEAGISKADLIEFIHEHPEQLTTPSPPNEFLPIDYAIAFNKYELAEPLLLQVPNVYSPEYLIELAKLARRKHNTDCLKYFYQAIPIGGSTEQYLVEIQRVIGDALNDD